MNAGARGAAPAGFRQALALSPRRLLASGRPWRSLGYLFCGAFVLFLIMAAARNGMLLVEGLPGYAQLVSWVFLAAVLSAPVAAVERLRLRLVEPEPVGNPHLVPDRPGLRAWLRLRAAEAATWREFSYTIALPVVLPLIDLGGVLLAGGAAVLIAAPFLDPLVDFGPLVVFGYWEVSTLFDRTLLVLLGLVLLVPAAYAVTALAVARSAFARLLLAPRESETAARVQELTRSRVRLADAFEAERRRIERDLHDGAQQRLVALIMTLGLLEHELQGEAPDRARLAVKARGQAEGVLTELRELIRGIHPQLLTDRGVAAAVAEIADRSPVPVQVDISLPARPASAVETVAYFAVQEALTNVVKHSGARTARVTGGREGDLLVLRVVDDGVGGAVPRAGHGLQGLADRVAVVGGGTKLCSPPGGPTELLVELPWRTPDCA
ncbi:sensor histidine kinase [Streptomyces koyangensis]|uniref:histidine kinase n=1 Tax=Streptomyces koyangensis TaxID=188770 RepID=A0ABX7EG92_9ACTN|nr:sensor domain-containing protein [Streptomyces koyangensis]QRF03779.1 sensor histidine kinase [Streptomyces koyangensis]